MTAQTPGRGVSGLETPLEGHPGPAEFEALREQLAAIEHQRWAHWQQWMHGVCYPGPPSAPGSLVIPAELVQRWERQIATPYEELSEAEKQSDREQVDRYWPLIEAMLAESNGWAQRLFDQRDAALDAVARVRALHKCSNPPYRKFCAGCLGAWPCETVQALEGTDG